MTDPIPYRGMVSRGLFMRAQRLHAGRRWALGLLVFPAVFIIVIAFGWYGSDQMSIGTKLAAIGVSFLWPALMYPFMLGVSWRRWSRVFRASPYLKFPMIGTLTDEGIEWQMDTSGGRVPWDRFIKRKEADGFVLLYQSPVMFTILARDFFDGDTAWQSALALVASRVKR